MTPILDGEDLMGLHNLPCSSVTNSRTLLVLMLSQFTLFSAKSHESWLNQKSSLARLVMKEFESIFLLRERCLCKVQGHAVSVGKGKPSSAKKYSSRLHVLVDMDVLLVTAQ